MHAAKAWKQQLPSPGTCRTTHAMVHHPSANSHPNTAVFVAFGLTVRTSSGVLSFVRYARGSSCLRPRLRSLARVCKSSTGSTLCAQTAACNATKTRTIFRIVPRLQCQRYCKCCLRRWIEKLWQFLGRKEKGLEWVKLRGSVRLTDAMAKTSSIGGLRVCVCSLLSVSFRASRVCVCCRLLLRSF
jgi:hypothetical protein